MVLVVMETVAIILKICELDGEFIDRRLDTTRIPVGRDDLMTVVHVR